MESRFRLVATAISAILIVTACNTAASPSPSAPAASVPAASAPAASGSAAAGGQQFAGVTVHLLTFNGPQIAEPPSGALRLQKLTGATINVDAVPFQDIYDKALLDMSAGTNSYDAFVFDPQWMGDFVGPGYLEDLTSKVTSDATLNWSDIGPFFRDFNATYGGKVYTIPLDGDFHMVYYKSDQVKTAPRRGMTTSRPPRSSTARTSTATAPRTTARASPRRRASRATGGSSRSRPA